MKKGTIVRNTVVIQSDDDVTLVIPVGTLGVVQGPSALEFSDDFRKSLNEVAEKCLVVDFQLNEHHYYFDVLPDEIAVAS
jgi:hypothetical protein